MCDNDFSKLEITFDNYQKIKKSLNLLNNLIPKNNELYKKEGIDIKNKLNEINLMENHQSPDYLIKFFNLKNSFENKNLSYEEVLSDLTFLMTTDPFSNEFKNKMLNLQSKLNSLPTFDSDLPFDEVTQRNKRDLGALKNDLTIVKAKNQIMEFVKTLIEMKLSRPGKSNFGTVEEEMLKKQENLNELFDLLEDVDLQKLSDSSIQKKIADLVVTQDKTTDFYKNILNELSDSLML